MKKARVVYNPSNDSFEVQINTGDGWGLDVGYFCVARAGVRKEDADFISYQILVKLEQLRIMGYKIVSFYM